MEIKEIENNMNEIFDGILENTQEVEGISLEEAIKETCKSIKFSQKSNAKMLKAQIDRLNVMLNLIENDFIFTEKPSDLLREINSIIKSLMTYEFFIDSKLDSVDRIYKELC